MALGRANHIFTVRDPPRPGVSTGRLELILALPYAVIIDFGE